MRETVSRVNYMRDSVLEIIGYVRYREEVKIKKGEEEEVRGREMRVKRESTLC